MAAPDFSNIPAEDLQHIANNDWGKVSPSILHYLAGEQQPVQGESGHRGDAAVPGFGGTLAGEADIAATGASALGRGVVNAGQDLWHRITGQGPVQPGQELAGQAHLGEAGKKLVGAVASRMPSNGGISDEELAANGVTRQQFNAEDQKPTSQLITENAGTSPGGVAASVVGHGMQVGGDVLNLLPAVAPARGAAEAVTGAVERGTPIPFVPTGAGTNEAAGLGFRDLKGPGATLAGPDAAPTVQAHNGRIGNAVINHEAGLPPDTAPTPEALTGARDPAGEVYQRTADSLPAQSQMGPRAAQIAETAGAPEGGRVSAGSPQAQTQIDRLREQLLAGNGSGRQWVNEMRGLRQEGFQNIASDDVSNQQLGRAQLDFSRAVEAHIEDTLPENAPVDMAQLQDARTALAKNQTAQSILKNGQYDLSALARIHRADPTLLTGPMRTAAEFADANPEAVGRVAPNDEPGVVSDLRDVSLTRPASVLQPLVGALGRHLLTGGTDDVLARTNRIFEGRQPTFPERPMTGLAPPPGSAGIPPQQGSLGDLLQGPGPAPQLNLEPPPGNAVEPMQRDLGSLLEGQGPGPANLARSLKTGEGRVSSPKRKQLDLGELLGR